MSQSWDGVQGLGEPSWGVWVCRGWAGTPMEQQDPGLEIPGLWGAADVTQRQRWV